MIFQFLLGAHPDSIESQLYDLARKGFRTAFRQPGTKFNPVVVNNLDELIARATKDGDIDETIFSHPTKGDGDMRKLGKEYGLTVTPADKQGTEFLERTGFQRFDHRVHLNPTLMPRPQVLFPTNLTGKPQFTYRIRLCQHDYEYYQFAGEKDKFNSYFLDLDLQVEPKTDIPYFLCMLGGGDSSTIAFADSGVDYAILGGTYADRPAKNLPANIAQGMKDRLLTKIKNKACAITESYYYGALNLPEEMITPMSWVYPYDRVCWQIM